jgi:hypothetical protein
VYVIIARRPSRNASNVPEIFFEALSVTGKVILPRVVYHYPSLRNTGGIEFLSG